MFILKSYLENVYALKLDVEKMQYYTRIIAYIDQSAWNNLVDPILTEHLIFSESI